MNRKVMLDLMRRSVGLQSFAQNNLLDIHATIMNDPLEGTPMNSKSTIARISRADVAGSFRLIGLLTLSLVASPNSAIASLMPGWTPPLTIQNIIVNGDEAILVIQGGIAPAYLRDDCNSSPYNVIDLTSPGGRARLTTAYIAYTSSRQISLALQACDAGRPAITHIQM
jgi:hypothetical protein